MPALEPHTDPPASQLQAVQGVFQSTASLLGAVDALGAAGFDRSRLTLPPSMESPPPDPHDVYAEQAEREDDEQQLRTLTTSTGAAAAALAGAAVVIATGGAAAVALAVAAGAGLAAGGAIHAVNDATNAAAAADCAIMLGVRTGSAQELTLAEQTLRTAGAWIVVRPAIS